MKNTFAYFKNIDNYTSEYNSRNNAESHIDNQTICFIEDGGKIYTHGKQFGGGSGSDTTTIGGETINVITEDGVKVIDPTNLPKAGVNKLGILGLKLGGGVKIDSNTMIYVDPAETLQNIKQYISEYPSTEMPMTPASKTKLGGVIVGNGIDVASNGKISVNVQEVKNMFTNAGITFGGASKLSDLEDVIGTPVSGQVLKWNGSKWAPATDETGEGGSGAPANYVIGWTVSDENVTFADNKNNTVTINTSGSSSSIDDFGVNPISNDTFDGPMFELEIMEGASAHTAILPTIISSDNSVTINQSTSNGLYAIDLSVPAGSRPGDDPMITAARYDVLGGLKAFDANETLSLGASVAGELYYSQDAYGRTDDSVVLPLRIDNSKDFGYIEIPNSVFPPQAQAPDYKLIGFSQDPNTDTVSLYQNNVTNPFNLDLSKYNYRDTINNIQSSITALLRNSNIRTYVKDISFSGGGAAMWTSVVDGVEQPGATTPIIVANPTGTASTVLNTVEIDGTNYKVAQDLTNLNYVKSVSVNPILTSSTANTTKIASITVDGTISDIYAYLPGSGDGGTTTIENPYDDTAVLNRITAAENDLRSIHRWTESEISTIAKDQVDTYGLHKDDIGLWIENGDFDEGLLGWLRRVGVTNEDGEMSWSSMLQTIDQLRLDVNQVTQNENTHYTALNSSLNTQISRIDGLDTSIASLGTSYSNLTKDGTPYAWLASYYNSMTNKNKTMAQVLSDVQTTAGDYAVSAVQTEIDTLDGKITSAKASLDTLVEDVDGLKSNSAGYLTQATLDGAVATMFASSSNGATGSGKDKVAAYIEARVGDMVSEAAQGQGALSELKLSADLITLDGNTTVAGALTADYIKSKIQGTDYLYVKGNTDSQNSGKITYTTICPFGMVFTNTTGSAPKFEVTLNLKKPLVTYNYIQLRPTTDDTPISSNGINMWTNSSNSEITLHKTGTGGSSMWISTDGISAWESEYSTADSPDRGSGSYPSITADTRHIHVATASNAYFNLYPDKGSTFTNDLTVNGTFYNTSSGTSSDIRYKNIVDDVHMDIADIAAAPKFTYTNKDDQSAKKYVGTSAQYWQDILPESVTADENGRLYMQYGNAALVAAISAAEEIVALKNEIAELKQQIAELKSNN